MRNYFQLAFLAVCVLLLGSCQKEVRYNDQTGSSQPVIQPVLPAPVTATLQGTVQDENGLVAPGVTIKVGTATATTDSRGFFRITGASLDKNQSLVTATKAGYFKAYRSFAATSGANNVVIKLIKRNQAGTVDATAGGTASLSDGSKVTLPAGGVVDASTGAVYTGAVKVYAAYIDPSAQDISATIPGSLMADDKDGRRVLLTSYGMLAVELEGASGQKLQIKNGSQATLAFTIPTAAQASAPATIPLWYVDESTGIWKEQGTATKTGNQYVGNVAHFSFWNCDAPNTGVLVHFTLKNGAGQPLVGAVVRLSRGTTGWNSTTYGITDSLGQVSGMVPANEALTLAVMTPCSTPVYTQNVGPYSTATTVPPITVAVPAANATIVTGTLQNCNGAAVTNGFVIVTENNVAHFGSLNAAGQFSVPLISCPGTTPSIGVFGIDNSTNAQSATTTVASAAGTINVGNIAACGTVTTQFITWTIDGGAPLTYSSPQDSIIFEMYPNGTSSTSADWQLLLTARPRISNQGQEFYFSTTAMPGNGATSNYAMGLNLPGYTVTNDNVSFNFSTWAFATGEYVVGTLSGTFGNPPAQHTFTSNFRLRRSN